MKFPAEEEYVAVTTFPSLQASTFVKSMELNTGAKISCLEEIAYNQGFISGGELLKKIEKYGNNPYYNYVRNIIMHDMVLSR